MQVTTTSPTAEAGSGAGGANRAALDKVAQQFEAVFLRQMIGAMRSASLAEGITDSSATQQFQDMADARTADAMAEAGVKLGWTGGTNKRSVSELVISFAVQLLRHLPEACGEILDGGWRQHVGRQLRRSPRRYRRIPSRTAGRPSSGNAV